MKSEMDHTDPVTGGLKPPAVSARVGTAGGATVGTRISAEGWSVAMARSAIMPGFAEGGSSVEGSADAVDPASEDGYWRDNHDYQEWANPLYDYADYESAYRLGASGPAARDYSWDMVEPSLELEWVRVRGKSRLDWGEVSDAVRGAWCRVHGGVARRY